MRATARIAKVVLKSVGVVLGAVVIGAALFVRLQGQWEGWRVALVLLALLVLFSVAA